MDNKKIGKLIASLRKEKGLTQQELGDMVGVGFRAVSKWECGMTLPDIAIINELSKIFGISIDELMSGEINAENENKQKKKISSRTKNIIITLVAVLTLLVSFLIYYNNNTYIYDIYSSEDDDYYVDGKVSFNKDNISIIISKVSFRDNNFLNTVITNYEYEITINENFIFGYGHLEMVNSFDKPITIKEFTKNFNINYDGVSKINREEIINNNLILSLTFLTEKNEEIVKEIKISLTNEYR